MGIWMEGLTSAQITFRLASICLVFLDRFGWSNTTPLRTQTVASLLIVT